MTNVTKEKKTFSFSVAFFAWWCCGFFLPLSRKTVLLIIFLVVRKAWAQGVLTLQGFLGFLINYNIIIIKIMFRLCFFTGAHFERWSKKLQWIYKQLSRREGFKKWEKAGSFFRNPEYKRRNFILRKFLKFRIFSENRKKLENFFLRTFLSFLHWAFSVHSKCFYGFWKYDVTYLKCANSNFK